MFDNLIFRNSTKDIPETKNPTKVELQVLNLQEESHIMIMSTLKFIHGEDFSFGTEADYKDRGSKIKKSYWKERGELIVQGGCDYSYVPSAESGEEKMKLYALMKLESYGFHKRHCLECLDSFNDNIDDSINLMFDKYFPTRRKDVIECDLEDETRFEMMNDELESLKSIYGPDEFQEVEKNHIWQFKLRLDYLLKFSPSEEKKSEKQKQLEIEARLQELHQIKMRKKMNKVEKCRNMMDKGKCKFGEKCRFSHDIHRQGDENGTSGQHSRKRDEPDDGHKTWHVEIRFPKWIKYPAAPPIVLLRTKIADIPKSICLTINQRLIDESRELAKDQIPSVYSIIDLLKNEDEILSYLNKNSFFKCPPAAISIFDYDPHEAEDAEEKAAALGKLPSHYQLGRVDKFDKRPVSEHEVLKENLNLIRKFQEKQKNSYYQKMLVSRQNLPAWAKKDEIVQCIISNQVVVISGDTGCGKSTQVPQFILDNWMEKSSGSKNPERVEIIVTQPRRIAAIGVAERISDERNEKIGGVVGYQIRLENKISSSTRLTFCTTGILLRRLYSDPLLQSVSHLIIDEVHERSEESDFLLMILKEVLQKRPQLKVILMSATLNSKLFSEYFNGAPVLTIEGRTFPVQQVFLEDIIERSGFILEPDTQYSKKLSKKDEEQLMQELEYADVRTSDTPPSRYIRDENLKLSELIFRYIDYSKTTCKTLFLMNPLKINPELIETVITYIVDSDDHEWPREGTILVFLPGLAEIQSVFDQLMDSKRFGPRSSDFVLVPLHSTLSSEEQNLVFKKMSGKRKIILSTNIAETSVTIDDCVFVIDAGQQKEKHFDSNRNMESLETVWISRANASQRKGRAGRVMPGICIHLFTKHRHDNNLLSQPIPEIHRIPLEQLLLRVKMLPNFEGHTLSSILNKSIEPPSEENTQGAIKRLQNLGAFDDENLTALGTHLALLPVDVRIGKLMLFGAIFQCLDSVLTICACLSHKSPFVSPFSKRQEADARKRQFAIGNSDHLTVLNAYRRWKEAKKKSRYAGQVYADENYLSTRTLEMLGEIKFQFLELLISIGFVPVDMPKQRKGKSFEDNLLEITGKDLNANSENSRLIGAILCAALYPNVVKVITRFDNNYKKL